VKKMCKQFAIAAILTALPAVCSAGTYVVPTTTLAAQTSNNTSAANTFVSQSNGNLGAGNISKDDIHTLLYPEATTKIYAHLMLWFGQNNHMNVGYSSTDPAQVKRQVTDMISRGITGVIIDWYGPGNSIDQAAQLVMAEAENHPGFTFAIMVDQGAIEWDSCQGCTPQQALIAQLQYVEQTYFPSPAYMMIEGKPMVTNFNIDFSYSIDWNAAAAALSTQPAFLFQNNNGFTHTLSDGSYSWVMPTTTDYGMSYLTSFYDTGMTFPSEQTVGATYKGFNDTLASWGSDRIMSQQCGQTWLQTFSEINGLYNAAKPLHDVQLVTWNDYEEGTEIESGISNCFTVAASASSGTLQWTITGSESTIDSYRVYISTDGQDLMQLAELAPGLHSLNLCSYPIPAGTYQLFVQSIGKPTMANYMTGPISYSPACNGGGTNPVTFNASPAALTLASGQSATLIVTATPQSGAFNNAITLSCAGLPSSLSCSFSPVTITPGASSATSTLIITAAPVVGMQFPRSQNPLFATLLLPFGIAGFVSIASFNRGLRRRRLLGRLALLCAIGISMAAVSCGGVGSATHTAPAPSTYSITVAGSSTPVQLSTTVTVTIQ
jgi:hypothetical protein